MSSQAHTFFGPWLLYERILAKLRGRARTQRMKMASSAVKPDEIESMAARTASYRHTAKLERPAQGAAVIVEEATLVEQARLIHTNTLPAAFFGFVVACLFVAVFSPVMPMLPLLVWLGAAAVLTGARLLTWRSFQRETFDVARARYWLKLALIGAGLSGSLWGVAAFFLLPVGQFNYQLIFVYAVVMMATTAMFSYHAYYPNFLAFVLPMLGMTVVGLFIRGADLAWGIVAGILIFLVVALRFMWSFNAMFVRSLQLRFENIGLVDSLTQQKEAAESANQAKSRFLAAASHDLRQPMHALNLYLGSLDGLELPGNARPLVTNLRMCAGTMDEMFRALLDISKLDAHAVQSEIVTFPVASILDRIRNEFGPQAQAKGLRLRVMSCSAFVRSDLALSERILRNFVHNAVRYTERGTILVGCRRHGCNLQLAVYDNGIGIAEDEQQRIFEEFYQTGNRERDRSKGLGLGLAIVQRLASLLEAPVSVRSKPRHGSMFAFELPRVDGVVVTPPKAQSLLASVSRHSSDVTGSLVVAVDDEPLVREAMHTLLKLWGCTPVVAASRSSALEALAASPRAPDAIICDYRLGDGDDGVAVIEALRNEFNSDIPALLVTGDTGPDSLRQILDTGMPVLHKPIDSDALRSALSQLLTVNTGEAELSSH
ncbi:MAG TPA: ATP-binding protein [Rhodocyclaceae bacterium]|nr:ATP-binding protein [Rhodocyclaceae bacterium]